MRQCVTLKAALRIQKKINVNPKKIEEKTYSCLKKNEQNRRDANSREN